MTHVLDALGRIKEYWGAVALADLDDYAQGRIVRGGAVDWEAYDASTVGAVLIGDGTNVTSDISPTIAGLVTGQAGFIATGYTIAGAPAASDYMVFGMDSPTGRIFAYDPVAAAYLALLSDVDIYRLRYTSTDINVLHYLLRLEVFTSNVAAAGLGTGIEFQIEDAGGGFDVLGTIECITTDATAGAEHGAVIVRTADTGDDGLAERWRWDHDGAVLVAGPSMTVPAAWNMLIADNAADAMGIDDAGGLEYMRIDSRNAQPIFWLNPNLADVDFRVPTSGAANAFYLQGSSGTLGLGMVPSSLSAYAIEAYRANNTCIISAVTTGAGNFSASFQANSDDSQINFAAYDDGYVTVAEYTGKCVFQGQNAWLAMVASTATFGIEFYTGGRAAANKRLIIDANGQTYPGANKTQDLGLGGTAWDDCWADDFQNEPDFFFMDRRRDKDGGIVPVDDLAILMAIRASRKWCERTGLELIDDDSLPTWVFTRDEETRETIYGPDGKPWISSAMVTSLTWGAIRQLTERIKQLEVS